MKCDSRASLLTHIFANPYFGCGPKVKVVTTMVNSINFTYLGKLQTCIRNVVTKCHMLVKGFMSKGGAMHDTTFDFIVNLNMYAMLVINVTNIQDFKNKGLHPIHQLGFAKQNYVILITYKCFGKTFHNLVVANIGVSQVHP
jgi:hypothetical protein